MSQRAVNDLSPAAAELTDDARAPDERPRYPGPRDTARAESLYRTSLTKPELGFSIQLLVASLAADPEHENALKAMLARGAAVVAGGKKVSCEYPMRSPVEAFLRSLVGYCSTFALADAITAATEAQRLGLHSQASILGEHALQQQEIGRHLVKPALLIRLSEVLEEAGDLGQAIDATRMAQKLATTDQAIREREKNLQASKYVKDNNLTSMTSFKASLNNPQAQAALHQPKDPQARINEVAQQYQQTHSQESLRELIRLLRGSSPEQRQGAMPILQDGLNRFGDKGTNWFIREVQLERRWSEVRLHQQMLEENPTSPALREEQQRLHQEVLAEQIEFLYEVIGSLPNTPERNRRALELCNRLLDAGRYEEAVRQAQLVKRQSDQRLDAWLVMAKAFVQLGLNPEAEECFRNIIAELGSSGGAALERVLEAKHSYAAFLLEQAKAAKSVSLASQARKLCSDVMVEQIDYRDIRRLSAEADKLMQGSR